MRSIRWPVHFVSEVFTADLGHYRFIARYPGHLVRGSVFLVCSLLLSALLSAFIMGSAFAQLARLDSVTLRSAATVLGRAQDTRIDLDSALQPLSTFLPAQNGATVLKLSTLSSVLDTSTAPAILTIEIVAETAELPRETRQWSTIERVDLLPEDRLAIETHRLRFVTLREQAQQGTLWSDVLEPVIVVLGAGAIVALFFLIRS